VKIKETPADIGLQYSNPIQINSATCKACGICGEVCPCHILEVKGKGRNKYSIVSVERSQLCMFCGQCAAVCPTNSIEVSGLNSEEYGAFESVTIKDKQLLVIMKQRRLIRRYEKKPVHRDVFERIMEAVHLAPTGTGSQSTGIIIINESESLISLSELVYQQYERLSKVLKNPIGRLIVKQRAGRKGLGTLQGFVMPGMRWYIKWYRDGISDEIRRDCPALMLFHSPMNEPMGEGNCVIATTYAEFMAQALGVGACRNDLIPPICNRSHPIRELIGLPADREVYSGLTLGYSKYKYQRQIPRRVAEVRYL
jgi:formate hydrogenlyase subunit 6/NADH:ubiquinone oxidoreductase subunit I